MAGPSRHLSWQELACHDGTPYPPEWRTTRAADLAAEFEAIRAIIGMPLLVASAYRTPAYNQHIGGARASQHVQGRALDLVPVRGVMLGYLWDVCRARAADPSSRLRGLGRYPTFIHIDTRPSARLVVWHG